MPAVADSLEVLLIVPFQPLTAHGIDPVVRQSLGAHLGHPLAEAAAQFEQFLGHSLNVLQWTDHPMLHGETTAFRAHRSLTAMTLATHLERQGVRWGAIDPGVRELRYWRRCFERIRSGPPRVVAVSTTFVMSAPWLRALCALVRRILPQSTLVVGGSFYLTNVREFLSLGADVFCFGEGEQRLPRIVAAVRDGRSLDEIPGLCCRTAQAGLRYTGPVSALNLDELPPVDWTLVNRVQPPVELDQQLSCYPVETQRGCAFQCEFCTYRTLTPFKKMSPDNAASAILNTRVLPDGYIFLVDATASFPPKRWEEVLTRLAERGGAPHPVTAFARVTDISQRVAELMWRAGVRGVVVGQESGDQQLLDAMRKGTRVEHVPTAVGALGRYGIGAQFSFIHGFPGETTRSIQATRSMIAGLNQQFQSEPVVLTYNLAPFSLFDFASVSRTTGLQDIGHFMGYDSAEFSPQRVAEEMLGTVMAASRVEHAPLCSFLFNQLVDFLFNVTDKPRRYEIFRWLKAFERGVAIFLERNVDGSSPDQDELQRLRRHVLEHCPAGSPLKSALSRMASRTRARQIRRVRAEWAREKQAGPGLLTRSYAALSAYRDLGRFSDARAAWKTATYTEAASGRQDPVAVEKMAAELIQKALYC